MTSFLVCHKQVSRFSPPRNPSEEPHLAGCKDAAAPFVYPNETFAAANRLKKGGGLMKACFKLWSVVAVGLALLAPSLRAEFVYVANANDNNVSAYRIGDPFPGGQ
jgi:hypothetical protein